MEAFESEEQAVIYILCRCCIRKNISTKSMLKIFNILEINIFQNPTEITNYITSLGWKWNKQMNGWEPDWLHPLEQDISTELNEKLEALKLPYTLRDLDKEIQVSPNDAETLLKNMACIQSKINEIVRFLNRLCKDKKIY